MKTAKYQVDLNFKADLNHAKRFFILFFFFSMHTGTCRTLHELLRALVVVQGYVTLYYQLSF